MNSDRFAAFHARQAVLGACRCRRCRATWEVAAADLRAPEADVADGAPGEHEAAAAAPSEEREIGFFAPFGPTHGRLAEPAVGDPMPGVRRVFQVDRPVMGDWEHKLARAKAGGGYGP